MTSAIPYGSRQHPLNVGRGTFVGAIESRVEHSMESARDILGRALENPIASQRLREIARGRRSAAILIPGKTRVAGTQDYLPLLLQELNDGGIPDSAIEVFLATGTHEPHVDMDVDGLLGPQVATRVRCVPHDCQNTDGMERLGATSAGTPVLFSKRVLQADVKVLTGRVVPHYFAGFAGGRKAMLPGVAAFETIKANHKLTLHPENGLHPDAACCSLDRNPIHCDMVEAVKMASPDFTLNTIFDGQRKLAHAVAGDVWKAHEEITCTADSLLRIQVQQPVDALITSPGGEPSDVNFMQSLKALFNFKDIVKPGGAMLWIAQCPHGIHPGFLDFGAIQSDDEMEHQVRTRYALTGHNSMMLRQLLRKVDVAMLSSIPAETVERIGIHPVATLDEGVKWLESRFTGDFTYAVVPEANVICGSLIH